MNSCLSIIPSVCHKPVKYAQGQGSVFYRTKAVAQTTQLVLMRGGAGWVLV